MINWCYLNVMGDFMLSVLPSLSIFLYLSAMYEIS